jgi:glucose dehydrogenase
MGRLGPVTAGILHRLRAAGAVLGGALLLLAACQTGRPAASGGVASAAEGAADQWLTTGGDIGKTHFSRLADIDTGNVARLGFAWEYQTGTNRVLEATPVVADGVMYASGPLGRVWALDAATGRELWKFEPDVDMQVNRAACCDQANRGVALAARSMSPHSTASSTRSTRRRARSPGRRIPSPITAAATPRPARPKWRTAWW